VTLIGERVFVFIGYMDDAGSDEESPVAVMTAVLVKHQLLFELEAHAGQIVERLIPKERLRRFNEFKACDLFHANGIFTGIDPPLRMEAMHALLKPVNRFAMPVIYSAVDRVKLARVVSANAIASSSAINLAFRMCLLGVQRWLETHDLTNEPALLLCDDTNNRSLKQTMQADYRALRPKLLPPDWPSGRLERMHDGIYFGNSRDSTGIQVADLCAWVVRRSIVEQDVPSLFVEIEDSIACSKVEPEWSQYHELFEEFRP
jgi:hypothetical protein